jgi:hypothetical protein
MGANDVLPWILWVMRWKWGSVPLVIRMHLRLAGPLKSRVDGPGKTSFGQAGVQQEVVRCTAVRSGSGEARPVKR